MESTPPRPIRPSSSVASFVALAFAFSWIGGVGSNLLFGGWAAAGNGIWRNYLINGPSTWGPAVAAAILTLRSGGVPRIRRLLAALLPRASHVAWIVLVAVAGFALTWAAYSVSGSSLLLGDGGLALHLLLLHWIVQLVAVGVGEELGWRGWLLPRLHARRTLLGATIWTGLIWLLWHLPKLVGPLAVSAPLALVILSSAVLLSLIWIRTDGNLLVVAAAHVSINAPVFWIEASGTIDQEALLRGWAVLAGFYVGLAGVILVAYRDVWRQLRVPSTDVTPRAAS